MKLLSLGQSAKAVSKCAEVAAAAAAAAVAAAEAEAEALPPLGGECDALRPPWQLKPG